MVHQALFTLKDKTKNKLKCHMLQFLFGALSVKTGFFICGIYKNYEGVSKSFEPQAFSPFR